MDKTILSIQMVASIKSVFDSGDDDLIENLLDSTIAEYLWHRANHDNLSEAVEQIRETISTTQEKISSGIDPRIEFAEIPFIREG